MIDEERFGRTYQYAPKWEKWVDYNPDHRPSDSRMVFIEQGRSSLCLLEIKSDDGVMIGALTIRGTLEGDGLSAGRSGCGVFSRDDLLFD